mmetsp:Transcript_55128/g.124435  ORF Transcript_55128/g.124435 Transcript_55128/m.124435 type:complete len:139 (-) Transcript_55128:80-496(-)
MSAVKGKVIKCQGLRNADFFGKSDPFVRISIEAPDGTLYGESKTASKTDSLDPVWEDETFNFAHDDCYEGSIRFRVMDTGLGPDEELGEALVPVKMIPMLKEGDGPTGFTFSLGIRKKKSLGTITVTLGVVPKPGLFG